MKTENLYKAAKELILVSKLHTELVNEAMYGLKQAVESYEKQQSDSNNAKTIDSVKWLLDNSCGDLVLNAGHYRENTPENAKHWIYALDAMRLYASQQTASKDKQIEELKNEVERLKVKMKKLCEKAYFDASPFLMSEGQAKKSAKEWVERNIN